MKKINLETRKNLLENIIFSISVIFLYAAHTSFDMIRIGSVMPVGLFIIAIYASMFKNFVAASIFSFISGIFFDMATGSLLGSGAIFFVVFCALIHVVTLYYVRANIFSFLIFEIIMLALRYIVIWVFAEKGNILYLKLVAGPGFLKSTVIILIFSPCLYFVLSYLRRKWLGINDLQLD